MFQGLPAGPAGLPLPPPFAVHTLEEHSVVFLGRHRKGCVSHPAVSRSPVLIGSRGTLAYSNDNDLPITGHRNSFNRRKAGWVDSSNLGAHFFNGPFAHLLAGHITIRCDSEQHMPALLIEHGAHGHRRLPARARRALELIGA